jgi:hypothetical protein
LSNRCSPVAKLCIRHSADIWVLVPDEGVDFSGGIRPRHLYFRRVQLLEVAPVPMGDFLRAPSKHAARLREFFDYAYPDLGQIEQRALIDEWRQALRLLHVAADLPAGSRRRWVQPTVAARLRIGKEWHWPLQLRPMGDALENAARYALKVDGTSRITLAGTRAISKLVRASHPLAPPRSCGFPVQV